MGVVYVTALDDKEYIALSNKNKVEVLEETPQYVLFHVPDKPEVAPVKVPTWAFKHYRVDNDTHDIDYFETKDLDEKVTKVWRVTLRYDYDVIHYDYLEMPEVQIQTDPISIILKDGQRTRQIFISPALRVFETGWENV